MKILLAIDLSDHSNEAAQFVGRLPSANELEVSLVTVVNPPEMGIHSSTEMWYPEFLDHQREVVEAKHREIATMLESVGAKVSSHMLHGHIGGEVVHFAETSAVDWIVLGATGHSTIGRLLLGSVSDYVATHAKCSVLVLRPKTLVGGQMMKVSAAYDHSSSAEKILAELGKRRWPAGASLQLITAVSPVMVYRDDLFPSAQEEERLRRAEAERIATEAATRITNFDAGVEVDVVEGDHTGHAIVSAADNFHSQLLVVGDKGHSLFERLMLGSTSRYVLHHAHQSVLVVR